MPASRGTTRVPPSEFAKLRAHWYRRLRESGFEDAETGAGELRDTGLWYALHSKHPIQRGACADYYRMAGQYLHSAVWASLDERRAWEMHADGAAVREIATAVERTRMWVQRVVTAHRRRMLARPVLRVVDVAL